MNKAFASTTGLTLLDTNKNESCFITSSSNSGIMPFGVKLAALADTDTTDLVDTDLMDSVADEDWTLATGVLVSSNDLTFTAAPGAADSYYSVSVNTGDVIAITFTVESYSAGGVGIYLSGDVDGGVTGYETENGTYTYYFVSAGASVVVRFRTNGITTLDVTNISVKRADADRSVNGNHLP
jgi:hypothetical protein